MSPKHTRPGTVDISGLNSSLLCRGRLIRGWHRGSSRSFPGTIPRVQFRALLYEKKIHSAIYGYPGLEMCIRRTSVQVLNVSPLGPRGQ